MTTHAVDEMEPLDLELLQEFVGEEAAESLEAALEGLENGARLFIYPGDLVVDGDVSSKQLLAGCEGFEEPEGATASDRAFTIFVRGNLTVSGVLHVAQYHDLYVQRDARVGSVLSHTGNLVVRGKLEATGVIAVECNEEGGFLHAASCDAPLLCRFGQGGWDWAVSNRAGRTEVWEIPGDPNFVALGKALSQLGAEATFDGVRQLVVAGRTAELLRGVAP